MSDDSFTGRGLDLLNAVKAADRWISRAEIAHATGKNRLSPHDINLLERMVNRGLIEVRERTSNTPVGTAFEYRFRSE